MTTLDLHIARPQRVELDRSTSFAVITAALLVILMGIPALMAPDATITADGWHGNAASSVSLR